MIEDVHWFVGIDWATQSHRVCLLDAEGRRVAEREIVHGGAGLMELRDWLLEKTKATPVQIAVAIEMPHGPVVEMLLEHGFMVLAINPKQLDRFRDRFTVAGAKDDSRDALVLGDSLRTDRKAFRQLATDDPAVIELREWSRLMDELQQERTRLANRLRQQLWRYYPQAAELTDDVADDWFLALWQKVPTPAAAAKASEKAIARILQEHRIRRLDAATVLQTLRKTALFVAPGATEAACVLSAVLRRACTWSTSRSSKPVPPWTAFATASQHRMRRTRRGRAMSSVTWQSYAPGRESAGLFSPHCSQRQRSRCRRETITPCVLWQGLLRSHGKAASNAS